MSRFILTRYLPVSGAADGPTTLTAFDRALMAGGAGNFNLVKVSSILPPGAARGVAGENPPGAIVFAAMGSMVSETPGELISAAVAVGVPDDAHEVGALMEGSYKGIGGRAAEERVREMAAIALMDRKLNILRIESVSAECRVERVGAVFAAVLMW